MTNEKITVIRIRTDAGVFFCMPEEAPIQNYSNVDLKGYEHVQMTQAEYDDIPVTEDAKRFFAGKWVGSRGE